jgi:hypothetical protein
MHPQRAYLSSVGTSSVLIAGALLMLALVGAIVAFDRWPGASNDQPGTVRVTPGVGDAAAAAGVPGPPAPTATAGVASGGGAAVLAATSGIDIGAPGGVVKTFAEGDGTFSSTSPVGGPPGGGPTAAGPADGQGGGSGSGGPVTTVADPATDAIATIDPTGGAIGDVGSPAAALLDSLVKQPRQHQAR